MFSKSNIEQALNVETARTPEMEQEQENWRNAYMGKMDWNDENTPSMYTAAGICSELARAVTVELKSEITGGKRAQYLQEQYNRVLDELRVTVEKCAYNGTVIFRPFVRGKNIYVTVAETDCFFPLAYDEIGELTGVVFIEKKSRSGKYYTLLEQCTFEKGAYRVENFAYCSDSKEQIGRAVPLSSLPEWAELPEAVTFFKLEHPLFSVFKMPQNNHVQRNAPEGVAIFSKALEIIKQYDYQCERLAWEYAGSELAVISPEDMWRDVGRKDAKNPRKGEVKYEIPKGKERLYKVTGISSASLKPEVFNPNLRDDSYRKGADDLLRRIEFVCGFSYGILSDPLNVERTATEVNASKQRYYSTVSDVQKALEKALKRLIDVMEYLATQYYIAPQGAYDVKFQWDDSIIADRETEFKERLAAQHAGIIFAAENRAWYNGTELEQAQREIEELAGAFDNEPELI